MTLTLGNDPVALAETSWAKGVATHDKVRRDHAGDVWTMWTAQGRGNGLSARAKHAQLKHYPVGHFDVYREMNPTVFETVNADQIAFLRTHLLPAANQAHSTAALLAVAAAN